MISAIRTHGFTMAPPSTAHGGPKDTPWRHHGRSIAPLWWVHGVHGGSMVGHGRSVLVHNGSEIGTW